MQQARTEAEAIALAALRRLSPAQKLTAALDLHRRAWALRRAYIQSQHPQKSAEELDRQIVQEKLQCHHY